MTIIDHFDYLTKNGLKVIPLRENSKAPINKGWQKDWNWAKNREKFRQFPDANIGLLLGEIVDVEGDSEHANKMLLDIIGDYPHPSYRSTKSIHHLFKTPDPKLRIVKVDNIEFRGHGHQSVLPPSQHFGVEYNWLTELFPVPEMPTRLIKFYDNIIGKKPKTPSGCMNVWCTNCREKCFIHQKRFQLELVVFKKLSKAWECHKCRKIDLRPLIRHIKN